MKNIISIVILFSALFFSSCMMLHSVKDSDSELKDPVCGMSVTESSKYNFEYDGKIYYFCSDDCLTKFKADPIKYKNTSSSNHEDHSMGSMSTWHMAIMVGVMVVMMIFRFS